MAKGFLTGVICGGFVSAVGLALVSPMLPPIQMAAAPIAPVEAPPPNEEPVTEGSQAENGATETDKAPVSDAVEEAAVEDNTAQADQSTETAAAPMTSADDNSESAEAVQTEDSASDNQDAATTEGLEQPQPEPDTPEAEITEPNASEPDTAAPEVTTEQQNGLGTAVAPLEDQANGVTTNRLPSIGSTAPETENSVSDEGVPSPEAGVLRVDLSSSPLAIERNSVPVPDTKGRPLMAVVLKDMGPERTQLEGIEKLPFPVSIVLDVTAPDLDDAIAFYRGAGAELVMQADLPSAATPTDAEVNLQVQQAKLNMGVAVYMAPDSGFQTNAPLSRQISEILVASGHGLITRPEGLNTGHKNALKTGVPSALVFRDLDGNGQDNKVIRRFLDNAAFKADQEEGVILMGRAVPQTVAALVEWSLGNRVSSVAMVPVSAVLLGGS
ncbi:hypothetical protein ALP8811_01723 [Aliiroseovarius pelagivivens]|uniref:Divergent polysaccharide deacetylase n=1 Tax=Aliiroseovarius pelagivivens TaxID=1639690 RepID=A0A2R8ALD0_9RHOB|nr:divergent polysaccharide deacetylase family protein [Aliiroseovarius pelagivivens]SPF76709.1 hypothetical protein ALP8811_01723 [Aliiroseovarius pelagivivens]